MDDAGEREAGLVGDLAHQGRMCRDPFLEPKVSLGAWPNYTLHIVTG
jgi:hypothetical protein